MQMIAINASECSIQAEASRIWWKQRRGRAKSQQIPAARGQSQVRHRSPEKSPEICRHADGHDRRCQCHRKSDPRQNEWQGDGNEPAADAIGENEKKENEWTGGIAIAHEKSWPRIY